MKKASVEEDTTVTRKKGNWWDELGENYTPKKQAKLSQVGVPKEKKLKALILAN